MEQQQIYVQNPDPQTGLEESMWKLGLGEGGYPERPGEPDCDYFMRTGSCGFGDRCRFNHPLSRTPVTGGEYPERSDQPLCQYFLKKGTCKFGATCKYDHPELGGSVTLNFYGYPLRPGETECSYYVKTGQCKFGVTCKFNHPQPAGASVPPPTPTLHSAVQSPFIPSLHPYTTVPSWQVAKPSLLHGSYVQEAYGPIIISPGFIPVSGWSPYLAPVSTVLSSGEQHTVQSGSTNGGVQLPLSASAPAYLSPYPLISPPAGPSSNNQKEHNFPERPGQSECQFYLRTGDCKFGPTCRYHHPPEWSMQKTTCALNPLGLPLRPGAPSCTYYAQYGICKFGPTCKFNHPIGLLSYSQSASSLAEMTLTPYPIGVSIASLAPSPLSSDLRPDFIIAPPTKDMFLRKPLPGNFSSGSTGSIFYTNRSVSHPSAPCSSQSSTSLSSSNSVGRGGEGSGSS